MNALLSPFRFLLLNRWPFALLAALFWMGACSGSGGPSEQAAAPDATAAAEQLLAIEPAEDDTRMLVFGPVSPGTTMSSDAELVLEVPDTPGTYYLFVLDDEPNLKRGHAHRYAWLDVKSGASEVAEAEHLPSLRDPLLPDEPITLRGNATVDGVEMTHYTGTEPVGQDPGDKPLYGELQAVRQTRLANEPKRAALVADFGDSALMAPVAGKVSDDADAMGQWLTGEGFEVERISQFWGDQHPALGSDDRAKEFLDILKEYDDWFAQQPGEQHEFFLYLGSHVSKRERSFMIYDNWGKRDPLKPGSLLGFQRVAAALSRFPENVKITIFVDACYAGMMEEEAVDAGLDQRGAGMTLIAASGAENKATTGVIIVDSATEDFVEDGEDKDGDGDIDIKDRAAGMKEQSFFPGAYFKHWGNGDWGSLEKKKAAEAQVGFVRKTETGEELVVPNVLGEVSLFSDTAIQDWSFASPRVKVVYEDAEDPPDLRMADFSDWVEPVEPVTLWEGGHDPCFSPDGSIVAFIDAETGNLMSIGTDGTGATTILQPDHQNVRLADPAFSPEGDRIACWLVDDWREQKYPKVVYTDGSDPRTVSGYLMEFDGDKIWDGNDHLLVFAENSPEVEPHLSLKRLDVRDASHTELLDGAGRELWRGSAYPSRYRIAILDGENKDQLRILSWHREDNRVLASNVKEFEWGPGGRHIAYVDDWGDVFVVDLETDEHQRIAQDGSRPTWISIR